jgi:hypothetical protein
VIGSITGMHTEVLDASPVTVRDDIRSTLSLTWSEIAQVGAWLSGEERLAIANEARHAWGCKLCQRRKEALSPYNVVGAHDHLGTLPDSWIEALHRIVTDSGRITESWYDSMIAAGILEDEFIELLSLTTIITCADTFTRGIGVPSIPLPTTAGQGKPHRTRPSGAKTGPGWAMTIGPEDAGPELGNFYDNGHYFIQRSLTLVPDELRRFWRFMEPLYMKNPGVTELEGVERAISRAQMEFIATRVSKYLDCFY